MTVSEGPRNTATPDAGPRRDRDAIEIDGGYQHRALLEGPAVQRYWHQAKLELLDWLCTPEPGDRVLDVGCGSGVFANHLASYGASVLAIDGNRGAVAYATEHFGRDNVEFRDAQLDEIDGIGGVDVDGRDREAGFDLATCLEVVEHVYPNQVRAMLAQLRGLIRPGGRLLLTTPNYRGLWPLVEWTTDRWGPNPQMEGEQHINRYARTSLRAELEAAGFEVETLRTYATFAPFAAALSWPLAKQIDRCERIIDLPFGNLLAVVARNPEPVS